MADWDGHGLPPVAAERARRAAAGGAWTSLLSAPAAAGLQVAGFEPVGEVMGSMVQQIGWTGYQGCGIYGGVYGGAYGGWATPTITSSAPTRFAGFRPYVDALYRGYGTAMSRMAQEAATIGADGVVGIGLVMSQLDGGAREFTALGTGVRARGSVRPSRIFSTHLPGQDVAKLVAAGWMPTDLVYGISVAIRHDDWQTRQQAAWGAGNTEVTGYTELISHTRADARHRLAGHVRESGADGAIVSSMDLHAWEIEPGENHRDHVAEAAVFGTALVRFHTDTAAPTRTLTYLPLR
ncbi:heavy metal-binding domain-containing protein [Pseudonocardia xinjiangensis]|uniref:heavy metal-binding domain-containing protein n=1 Tax=Pseudonocardia xinjiangensis TaxID=75289 RepID=UPI003D8B8570